MSITSASNPNVMMILIIERKQSVSEQSAQEEPKQGVTEEAAPEALRRWKLQAEARRSADVTLFWFPWGIDWGGSLTLLRRMFFWRVGWISFICLRKSFGAYSLLIRYASASGWGIPKESFLILPLRHIYVNLYLYIFTAHALHASAHTWGYPRFVVCPQFGGAPH